MGFGREGAICEYIEKSCKILPGSSDEAALINASRLICKMAARI